MAAAALDVACLSEMGGAMSQNLSLSSVPGPCNQSTHRALPYSPEGTAVFATAITLMMIFTIVGNILVIIAVLTSRSLQGPQNLFLVSLAAADILVATLIIPFSLANELQGYWAFQTVWCEIYLALDVLFCTSSIVHLCAISLDRYLSISRPVSYGARRTPMRIKTAIVVVWLISAVISFPPLLSLDKSEGGVEVCELNNERWYILYSTIGSFFAPCVIMILVYIRIYQIAKQHTRCPPGEKRRDVSGSANSTALHKGQKASVQSHSNGGQGDKTADQSMTSPPMSPQESPPSLAAIPAHSKTPISQSVEAPAPSSSPGPNPLLSPTTTTTPTSSSIPLQDNRPHVIPDPHEPHKPAELQTDSPHGDGYSCDLEVETEMGARGGRGGGEDSRGQGGGEDCRGQGGGEDCRGQGGGEDGRGQGGATEKVKTTGGSPQGKGFKGQIQCLAQRYKHTVATPAGTKLASDRLPGRPEGTPSSRRKAMVYREKRFTFVLAVVVGVFMVCWFPFFFSYSLLAICKETCTLPRPLFKFFFWIGYCNSCLNPIIYTVFNKDFRKAFKKILCRNVKGTYF